MRNRPPSRAAALLAAACLAAAARPLAAQAVERVTLRGRDVAIYDPAGRVQLVAGSGADVAVEVTRGGRDAARLRVASGDVNGRPALRVIAPGRDLVYPPLGRWSNTSFSVRDDGTFGGGDRGRWFSNDKLTVRGRGDGDEAWADLVVRVPRGARVAVYVGAGVAAATNVDGDLTLDVNAAEVQTERTRGRLVVDAGSGRVRVADAEGDEVTLDTGSGSVELRGVRARRLRVDAGSGSLRGGDLQADALDLDTGSGSVEFGRVRARALRLDSGSGSVDLEFADDVEDVRVDSGSGSVTLRIPPSLGATVDIDGGSGGVRTDVPLQVTRAERHHVTGRLGDGRGRLVVDGGSGSIRLVPAR